MEETERDPEVLKAGWLHTGDIGWVDKDGMLYIVGRKKDTIKSKCFSISAEELEEVLFGHHAVRGCVVIPKQSPIAGEIPKAFVALKGGIRATESDLIGYVEARVPTYKKIREIEFVDEIPSDPTEKAIWRKKMMELEMMRTGKRLEYPMDKVVASIRRSAK